MLVFLVIVTYWPTLSIWLPGRWDDVAGLAPCPAGGAARPLRMI
jgi:hypothetical protein